MDTTTTKEARKKIKERLKEFKEKNKQENNEWFSELCFCILTANSKAETAIRIQEKLGAKGFLTKKQEEIARTIREEGHRFHNNKAKYIIEARKHKKIKEMITKIIKEKGEKEAREWLVKHIKGLGYKEASHFLRNVGYENLAILDRHILRTMKEEGIIKEIPKTLTRKKYLELEEELAKECEKKKISQAELDLILWWKKTGKILK